MKTSTYFKFKDPQDRAAFLADASKSQFLLSEIRNYIRKKKEQKEASLASQKIYMLPGWEGSMASTAGEIRAYNEIIAALSNLMVDK